MLPAFLDDRGAKAPSIRGRLLRARADPKVAPGDDGGRRLAGSFRLEFPTNVRGPILFGHSAHFGMGLFLPRIGPGHPLLFDN